MNYFSNSKNQQKKLEINLLHAKLLNDTRWYIFTAGRFLSAELKHKNNLIRLRSNDSSCMHFENELKSFMCDPTQFSRQRKYGSVTMMLFIVRGCISSAPVLREAVFWKTRFLCCNMNHKNVNVVMQPDLRYLLQEFWWFLCNKRYI